LIATLKIQALTPSQIETMFFVTKTARKYTDHYTTLTAICLVESSLGRNIIGDMKSTVARASLGYLQMTVRTTRWIATKYDSLEWLLDKNDHFIANLLLKNPTVNIQLASLLFEYHLKHYGYFGAVSRHNGGKNNHIYFNKVEEAKKLILKWRKRYAQ